MLLLPLVLGLCPCEAAAQPMPIGQVSGLVGTASAGDGAAARPLSVGAALHAGDRVTTGRASRLEIRLAPRPGGGSALLELLEGILRIDLAPEGVWTDFDVRTYTAVASVRSTQWVVEARPGRTSVFVVVGSVEVTDRLGRGGVLLEAGFGTDVPFGAAPAEPRRWGAARAASAVARTSMP
jgi:ferric-dicitrate binding protein FerR (iron transport regulator)